MWPGSGRPGLTLRTFLRGAEGMVDQEVWAVVLADGLEVSVRKHSLGYSRVFKDLDAGRVIEVKVYATLALAEAAATELINQMK